MVRQYEESRRSRMAVVLSVAAAEYADADEFELAVSCAASLGLRAVNDAREVDIVTGAEIPRVVRGRLRAIRHIPAASRRTLLDGFSAVDQLENTMAIADVCRLAAEANERLSIAFVVVGSQVSLGRLRQAALGFPADTAVVAVICDERAHPAHARPLGAHGPHGRHPRRSFRAPRARSDIMNTGRVSAENLPVSARVVEQDGGREDRVTGDLAPMLVPRIVAGSLFFAAVVAIAAVAAWPIYRDWSFLLLVGVCSLVAAAIAALAWSRHWGGWRVAGLVAIAFFVLGIPLAVPSRLGSPLEFLRGLADVGLGALFAWKDLVTVDLPVGTYRNLLVPALIVFLVGTCAGLLLSWRASRAAYGAVPVALAMVSFGLFFGRTTVSAPLVIGPVVISAPVETALGIAGLLASLLWLAWRSRDERMRSLRRAAASSGVRVSRRPSRADQRRTALGAGMLVGRRDRGRGGRAFRRAGGGPRRAARERRTRARCVVGGQPARAVPVAVRRRAGRRRPVHGDLTRRPSRARPAGHARQLRRRDLPQRRCGGSRSGPLRPRALDAGCRHGAPPSTSRSRSSSSTGSGCRPSGSWNRSTSRGIARRRSPTGSTTARMRGRACRPRAAA